MSAPLRVLILEDRPLDAELMLHELRRSGFDPDWQLVETEQDYIARLDPALDVILSDYSMPQFNGLRALHLLQERGLDIPFLIITGNVGEEVAVECMKQGAADYLLKDRLARLGQAVSHTLEQKRLREEKRGAETALRESEERFRRLVEQTADAFFIHDQEGRIVDVNQRACDSLGYTREKLLTLSISDFELHSAPGGVAEEWKQMVHGEPVTAQGMHLRQDGSTFPVETRLGVLESGERPLILALARDITERMQGIEALRLRTRELEALFNIASVLVQPGKFEEKATRVLEEVVRVASADWVTFRQLDQERQGFQLVAVAGPGSLESPPIPFLSASEPLVFDAVRQGEAVVANDYSARPNASANIVELGMNSMVLMPVKVGDQSLGLVNVVSRENNHFTPDLVKLLSAIADGLGVLLENAHLGRDLQASMEEMAAVDEVAKIICSTLDVDQVYEGFAAEVKKLVDFDHMGINVIDRDAGVSITKYLVGESVSGVHAGSVTPLNGSETRLVMMSGQPVMRDDLAADPGFSRDQDLLNAGLRSGVRLPLIAEGHVVGSLRLGSRRVGAYGPREQRILERLAGQIAPAIENALLYEQVVSELEQRELTEEALRESERRFRQISENMHEVVFLVDHQDYKVLYVNDAFEEIWGQPCESLYENPMIWIDAVHPDDRACVEAAFDAQQTTGEFEAEFRIIRSDGTIRWIFDRTFPIQNEAGEVYRLVGIAEDITARKETEQRLDETAHLASIGELAAGVAHELNNPLAGVLGFAELLMARPLSASTKEDVAKIYDQAQRASRVVQNLLSFARKYQPERRYIDVTAVVAASIELKAYDLATSNIHVAFDFSEDIPLTMADEHQLQRVFLNIIVNAEQAIVEHGGTGSIGIKGRKAGNYITLSFTDDGPGIPVDHLKRIFDPFFTTKEVGKGTGLGLSICYGIIHEHGGEYGPRARWAKGPPSTSSCPCYPSRHVLG